MNVKKKVDKRYRLPDDTHASRWAQLDEYRLSPRRMLCPGQVVKITGVRGGEFKFLYAEQHRETGDVNLTFVGGRKGCRLVRTFKPEKVGRFVRVSRQVE